MHLPGDLIQTEEVLISATNYLTILSNSKQQMALQFCEVGAVEQIK